MTEVRFVDPNTDNLDDFSALMDGTAKPLDSDKEDAIPPVVDAEVEEDDIEDDSLVNAEEQDEDEAEDDGDDDAPEPEAKPKSRFQERIDQLTQRIKDAENREREAARRLEEFMARNDKKEEAPKAKTTDKLPEGAPTPDDVAEDGSEKYPLGEFDPLYIRDLTRFTITQETERVKAEQAAAEAAREQEVAQAQLATEWSGKLEKAIEVYPDMLEKNAVLEDTFRDLDPNYGQYLAATIMSMDYGPDVLYYLANNVDEAKRIAASGATKATLALGRLESRFAEAAAEKVIRKPKVSNAPTPPITNKGSKVSKSVAPDTDDLDAFSAMFFAKT